MLAEEPAQLGYSKCLGRGRRLCQKHRGFLRWSCLDAERWVFVIHTAIWEGRRPEEAEGPARKDMVWNQEQWGAEGQWDWQHRFRVNG